MSARSAMEEASTSLPGHAAPRVAVTSEELREILSAVASQQGLTQEVREKAAMLAALGAGELHTNGGLSRLRALSDGCAEFALRVLEGLFAPGDCLELATLGSKRTAAFGQLHIPEERQHLKGFVQQNWGVRDIYYGVQPRTPGLRRPATASDVAAHAAVFLDIDHKEPDEAAMDSWLQAITEKLSAHDPTLVVHTGGGIQAVWRVLPTRDRAEMNERVKQSKSIIEAWGSDNVADLPRLARLPASINVLSARKRLLGRKPKYVRTTISPVLS